MFWEFSFCFFVGFLSEVYSCNFISKIKRIKFTFSILLKQTHSSRFALSPSSYPSAWLVKIAAAAGGAGGIMKDLVLPADKCGGYAEMQKQLITVRHIRALPAWQNQIIPLPRLLMSATRNRQILIIIINVTWCLTAEGKSIWVNDVAVLHIWSCIGDNCTHHRTEQGKKMWEEVPEIKH